MKHGKIWGNNESAMHVISWHGEPGVKQMHLVRFAVSFIDSPQV